MTSAHRPAVPLRRARGAVVGLVGGAVAVTGHVVAGGSALTPAVVAALAIVVAGCVVASRRRWTLARLAVALVAAQPAVHGALWLSTPTGAADPRLATAGARAADHGAHAGAGLDLRMLMAHAAAASVAAVVLLALEACALSLWSLLHAVRLVTRAAVVPVLHGAAVLVRSEAVAADGLVVVRRRPRRGPPAVLAPC